MYRLIKNIEKWGHEAVYGMEITQEELERLSKEWDININELKEDLEEVER